MIDQTVGIFYKNWKGETRWRRVVPQIIWFGASPYHPAQQWFMKALDLEKQEVRDFAMRDIKDWNHAL